MFNNNQTLIDLYEQITDFEAMKIQIYGNRKKTYGITALICFISTIYSIINTQNNTVDAGIFFPFFAATCFFIFAFLQIGIDNSDLLFFLWSRSENKLKDKKAEIIYDLSREKTQIDIVNFKFDGIETNAVDELKKSLALKEYEKSLVILRNILNKLVKNEQTKLTEAQTKKLIAEYELGLKMKL